MQAMEWSILFGIIVLALSTAVAVGQQLHSTAANASWWPL
jgi:hypothetical protein